VEALILAGLFTELGGGYKDFSTTSYILRSECAQIEEEKCGGDQPVFIGYPIAWEFKNGRTTIGWFHMSHWFDGNGESHFDCICVTHRFYWKKK
jgi:hypothetical protein